MMQLDRRSFLTCAATTATAVGPSAAAAASFIDTNVYLSRWPFRRIPKDTTPELVDLLREHGVTQAWTGSFDALLHKNLARVNASLASECGKHADLLVPFGAVNPRFPDWEEDLRRCHEEFGMPGIRLHPNYQNYTLADRDFAALLKAATERGLLVQIADWLEDQRHHNPLMQVPSVDFSPLPALMKKTSGARVVVLNGVHMASRARSWLPECKQLEGFAVDFGMLDALLELPILIDAAGLDRIVFGSFSPMFYFEANELKLQEADLGETEQRAIRHVNASRLWGMSGA